MVHHHCSHLVSLIYQWKVTPTSKKSWSTDFCMGFNSRKGCLTPQQQERKSNNNSPKKLPLYGIPTHFYSETATRFYYTSFFDRIFANFIFIDKINIDCSGFDVHILHGSQSTGKTLLYNIWSQQAFLVEGYPGCLLGVFPRFWYYLIPLMEVDHF